MIYIFTFGVRKPYINVILILIEDYCTFKYYEQIISSHKLIKYKIHIGNIIAIQYTE